MHICDMFDEMSFMAIRGPIKSLFKYLHTYHCFDVIFYFWKFHGVLGSGLSPIPQKVAQNLELLGQNYLEKSLVTCMHCCGSDWSVLVKCIPISRELLKF